MRAKQRLNSSALVLLFISLPQAPLVPYPYPPVVPVLQSVTGIQALEMISSGVSFMRFYCSLLPWMITTCNGSRDILHTSGEEKQTYRPIILLNPVHPLLGAHNRLLWLIPILEQIPRITCRLCQFLTLLLISMVHMPVPVFL